MEQLKAVQKEFLNSYSSYHRAKLQCNTATSCKKEALQLINKKLLLHLSAMHQVSEADYDEIATAVYTIIDDVNGKIKRREQRGGISLYEKRITPNNRSLG
ncbi:MAG: hypothetical protein ACK5JS_06360 [Mangrovibacterium sp.]